MAVKFKYCRIQGKELAANTMTGKGIFSMLNQMVSDGVMDDEDVGLFKEIDSWFAEELPWPPQCKRQEGYAYCCKHYGQHCCHLYGCS